MTMETIDQKVNSVIKKLSHYWHTQEKHNYLDVLHKEAYRMFMRYYVGNNPYNIVEDKTYQKRLEKINIVY